MSPSTSTSCVPWWRPESWSASNWTCWEWMGIPDDSRLENTDRIGLSLGFFPMFPHRKLTVKAKKEKRRGQRISWSNLLMTGMFQSEFPAGLGAFHAKNAASNHDLQDTDQLITPSLERSHGNWDGRPGRLSNDSFTIGFLSLLQKWLRWGSKFSDEN